MNMFNKGRGLFNAEMLITLYLNDPIRWLRNLMKLSLSESAYTYYAS